MHSSGMRTARLLMYPGGSASVGVYMGGSASRGVCLDGGWADPPPPVNRMTHRCKNITLSQTSFTGGYKWCLSKQFVFCLIEKRSRSRDVLFTIETGFVAKPILWLRASVILSRSHCTKHLHIKNYGIKKHCIYF